MGQYLGPHNDPKPKPKKRRTEKFTTIGVDGESTQKDRVDEVSSDENCSVVWLIK